MESCGSKIIRAKILSSPNTIIQSVLSIFELSSIRLKLLSDIISTGSGLIICGSLSPAEQFGFHPLLIQLSEKTKVPVLIDPLSNLRFSTGNCPQFIYNYDHFLKQYLTKGQTQLTPDWIIRFGQFPVAKNLMHYLESLDTHTILISSYGDTLDPIHQANTFLHCSPDQFCSQILQAEMPTPSDLWLEQWLILEITSRPDLPPTLLGCPHFFEGLF